MSGGLYFEAHVTLGAEHLGPANVVVAAQHPTWHVSCLQGDEVLGPEMRVYLSKRHQDLRLLQFDLIDLCGYLEKIGVRWQRRKIEVAILDERSV